MQGNNSPKNSALSRIAQQKMLRGQSTNANLIHNFGSLGQGAGRQALNNVLRGKTGTGNISNNQNNLASTSNDAINSLNKIKNIPNPNLNQKEEHTQAKNILDALG